jgi:hypothetical protein
MTSFTWPCEAYGTPGLVHGAACFVAADLGARLCSSAAVCAEVMALERQAVHGRLRALAAVDPDGLFAALLDDFPTPSDLLGGGGDDE